MSSKALNDKGDSVMVTMSKWPPVQFAHRYNVFHFLSIFLPVLVIFGVFVFAELILINYLILYKNFYSYDTSFYLKLCVRFVELQVTINLIAFRTLNYKDHVEYQLNRLNISEVKLRKIAVQKIMHSGEHLYANKRCLMCDRLHCPICDACVLRPDHHCAFFGSCVGIATMRFFYAAVFWLFLAAFFGLFTCFNTIVQAEPVLGECSLLYRILVSFYFIVRDVSATIRTIVMLEFSPEAWTKELDALFPLIFLIGFAGAGVWLAYMVMAMIFPMFGGILEWILMGKAMDGEGDNIVDRMRFCFGSWWLLNIFVPPIWKEVEWTERAVQGIITHPFRSELEVIDHDEKRK